MKTIFTLLAVAAATLVPTLASAQYVNNGPVRGIVGVALTGGGESLATVQYTDGYTRTVHTGGLVDIYGGVDIRQVGSPFSLQATIGYHFDNAGASNGNVQFTRIPLELVGMWNANSRLRIGAGLRYDSNVKLSSSGAASAVGDQKFDNAAGLILKGEYMIYQNMGLELRFVSEKYKYSYAYTQNGVQYSGKQDVNGDHAGVGFNYYF